MRAGGNGNHEWGLLSQDSVLYRGIKRGWVQESSMV